MCGALDRLPAKLGAAVKEYLRQRERGALQGHWTICLQVVKLLRGAYLTGDESVIASTKEVLIEMDMECEMVVHSMTRRLAHYDVSNPDSLVEEVRSAPTELQAELLGYEKTGYTTTMVMEGDHQFLLLDEEEKKKNNINDNISGGGIRVMKRNEMTDVTSILLEGVVSRCVIVSSGIHCAKGIAVCPAGSRVLARAARRLGIPVVIAAARFSLMHAEEGEEKCELPKRKRAHPGDSDNGNSATTSTNVVRFKKDEVPIEEANLIVTEYGGYHPQFVRTLRRSD